MKKKLKVPKFKNEEDERNFWNNIDLSEYYEPDDFKKTSFPNLKPSTKTISLRLSLSMLDDIKTAANKKDVPYQSYIKIILDEKIKEESRAKYKR